MAGLTHNQFVDLIRHALGKTPDARHDLWEAYNSAGRAFTSVHTWAWRRRGPVTLTLPANATSVTLPADFDTLESLTLADGQTDIVWTDLNALQRMRASLLPVFGRIYVAADTFAAPVGDNPPLDLLEIYPARVADTNLSMVYLASWVEASSAGGTGYPAIPLDHQHALKLLCRAMAQHIENQSAAFEDSAYQAELQRLILAESRRFAGSGPLAPGFARSRADRRPLSSWSLNN